MKKTALLLFFFLYSVNVSNCQTKEVASKYVAICKIWGILKYYAPNSELKAVEKADWHQFFLDDYAFIKKNIENEDSLQQLVKTWIRKSGKYNQKKLPSSSGCDKDNISVQWIDTLSFLTKIEKEYLRNIRYRKGKKANIYYEFSEMNSAKLRNFISNPDWSKESYQMLGLFEYWNDVEYFFAYKDLMSQNWDFVLSSNILNFIRYNSKTDFYKGIAHLSHTLEDGHAYVESLENTSVRADSFCFPFQYRWIDNHFLIYYVNGEFSQNLKIGDEILSIDNQSLKALSDSMLQLISYANIETGYFLAKSHILYRRANKSYQLRLLRNKDTLTIDIMPIRLSQSMLPPRKKYDILENNIGYIDLGELNNQEIKVAMKNFEDTKAIIIDLRNYPLEHFQDFLGYFTTQRRLKYAVCKINNKDVLGCFIPLSYTMFHIKHQPRYKGKVVALVNERTQSKAEFYMMFLKAYGNATIIGRRTSSSNGSAISFNIFDTFEAHFTGSPIANIDGSQYQKIGVIPDIIIPNEVHSFSKTEDFFIKTAVDFIEK